ncbi:hypothetical protein [Dickeya poaceiphila]|uniref:Uncharacterized protein n=1 Tax=Dickeya poaceiphila TaxID=568768 RepID=A0A5B8I0F1_9GAMM|nr:hypothetical protein [Dickeya poaceiphila]QDX28441.1 hypothetical protein Dpoa569_0000073 [Dickeya poaceiphila]
MKVNELAAGGLLLMLPLGVLAVAPYPVDDSHEFTEAQRAEIRRIVTEYLLAHPDKGLASDQAPTSDRCRSAHPVADNGKLSSCTNTQWMCLSQ